MILGPPGRRRRAHAEHVHECPPRVANGFQDFLQAAAAVVLDDDARAGAEVGLEVGVGPSGIAGHDVDAGVVEAAGHGAAFNDELHFEAGQQDLVEHPDDQLVLTDG